MRVSCLLGAVTVAALATGAEADMIFTAELTGDQEVGPVMTDAFGSATLTLNDAQTRLEILISITGIDLDGAQTKDPADDLTGAHIHRAPAGANGGVVYGMFSPSHDTNGDVVIDAVAGTITAAWDMNEGNSTTLTAELSNLFSQNLYINIHTVGHPGGEIRGQILPTPGPAVILAMAGLGAARRRRA